MTKTCVTKGSYRITLTGISCPLVHLRCELCVEGFSRNVVSISNRRVGRHESEQGKECVKIGIAFGRGDDA